MFIGLFALAIIISLGITLVIEKVVPKFENSAANTATLYIESINNKDFDSFCDCLMPSVADSMKEYAQQIGGGDAVFSESYNSMFSNTENYNFGENVTISISNISEKEQNLEDNMFNGQDISELNAKAVTIVSADLTTKGTLGEDTQKVNFTCMKIKNKWHIYSMASADEQFGGWDNTEGSDKTETQ